MSAVHILELAKSQGLMITTAESCTGGLIAAALTEIAEVPPFLSADL